ncbi:hypothetical protein AB0878_04380 [Amycolatopsis sp. NPDC047767]|uniref:hypothetical protein n=1 Tax=Amycolatopsis sp. NPDC047767 TaxID=3156765 RepID=UPI0034544247
MNSTVTTSLVSWVASLNAQVQGAAVSATATLVGVWGTAFVAVAGFRQARRLSETNLIGHRQQIVSERRFVVYEDAVKYLLKLARLRPENYNFWPEMSDYPPAETEITGEEHVDMEARLVAWASPEIRALWKEMEEADHVADVARDTVHFLKGRAAYGVPRDPVSAEEIAARES